MKHKFIFLVFFFLLFISNVAYTEETSKAEEMIKISFPNAQKVTEIDIAEKGFSGKIADFDVATKTGDMVIVTRESKDSDATIHYFDKNGSELWNYTTSELFFHINIAPNGEIVCAHYASRDTYVYINRIFDKSGVLHSEGTKDGCFYPIPDGKHLIFERGFQIYDLQTNPTLSAPPIKAFSRIKFISDNELLVFSNGEIDEESFEKEYRKLTASKPMEYVLIGENPK